MNPDTQKLIERVDKNRDARWRLSKFDEEFRSRMKIIREAFPRTKIGFWCERCKRDFDGIGYKMTNQVFDLDSGLHYFRPQEMPRSWYEGKCPKGHVARRFITDKHEDRYYFLSEITRRESLRMERDLIQPSDPRFKMIYPETWRKMQEAQEAREQAHAYVG